MIYPNGQRVLCYPGRHVAGSLAASGALGYGGIQGARLNRFVSDTYGKVLGAVPSGYGGRAWLLAVKAGGMSAFSGLSVSASGAGVLGMPGSGAADITFTVSDATGGLIASGSGSAAFSIALADALLTASINGSGDASFSITVTPALLGAIADGAGSAAFGISTSPATAYPLDDSSPLRDGSASFTLTGSLIPYAIGQMSGSTVDTSVLTAETIANAVWDAIAAQHTDSASMGGKLNTASSGGVDLNALAQAVWEHATRTLTNAAGLTTDQSTQLSEIWRIHGLDASAPLTVTPAGRRAGAISQTASGDGTTTTTLTRA